MKDWKTLAPKEIIQKTIESLKVNGINAELVETGDEAKKKVLGMIPTDSEVMTMSSVTLQKTGIADAINESKDLTSVKNKLSKLDRTTQGPEMQKLGAAPEYAVGSVHAVTEDGKVVIASNTGSQLPAYAYGSEHVIWVVGAQKIVENLNVATERIYDYVLPLESERMNKTYNVSVGSFVSKILIINREINPQRLHLIFVNEALGF